GHALFPDCTPDKGKEELAVKSLELRSVSVRDGWHLPRTNLPRRLSHRSHLPCLNCRVSTPILSRAGTSVESIGMFFGRKRVLIRRGTPSQGPREKVKKAERGCFYALELFRNPPILVGAPPEI